MVYYILLKFKQKSKNVFQFNFDRISVYILLILVFVIFYNFVHLFFSYPVLKDNLFIIGIILMYTAKNIDDWLPESGKPNLTMIVCVVFAINILSAIQDIVVDGWSLTMLKQLVVLLF